VFWNQGSQYNSNVIPGKLAAIPPEADQPQAEASATRNPEILKTPGFPFFTGMTTEALTTFSMNF
jgi:hypothetical protein